MDDFRDHYWAEIERHISKYGWSGQHVFPVSGNDHEHCFTYTIGFLETFGVPEVIISGLGYAQSMSVLHCLAERFRQGDDIEEGVRLHEIMGPPYTCMLMPVEDDTAAQYLTAAMARSQDKGLMFTAWQLLWPDADNHLPVQRACEPQMAQMQKLQ